MVFSVGWWSLASTVSLIATASLAVGWFVAQRQGNLAFDDADYLRRGLELARHIGDRGPWALGDVLSERPKPPWLVGWLGVVAALVGREHLTAVLVLTTALPYGLLLLAIAATVARWIDCRAAGLAVLAVVASPMGLMLAVQVMVETFLALWVLGALLSLAIMLVRPTPAHAAMLSIAVGLAALTKSTVGLFLIGPGLYVAARWWLPTWRFLEPLPSWRAWPRGTLLALVLPALLIAGPWYARNLGASLKFARQVARFEQLRGDGPEATSAPRWPRLVELASEVGGWPVVAAIPLGLLAMRPGKRIKDHEEVRKDVDERPREPGEFARVTLASLAGAVALGMIPDFFGSRYWLPIWPAVVLVLVGAWWRASERWGWAILGPVAALLVLGCVASGTGLARLPRFTTYWAAHALIDHLVERHHVRSLATLGKSYDWNVCKTGLINETRNQPETCFALGELSKLPPAEAARRAERFDALLVLDRSAIPESYLASSPGQNRAYAIVEELITSGRFEPIAVPTSGLPPLRVLLRRERLARR
jgi:hypothetical protein